MNIFELRKERKLFYSICCETNFMYKSNGLWTYYVCNHCQQKTTPINGKGKMLDLYGEIKTAIGLKRIRAELKNSPIHQLINLPNNK